MWYSGSIQEADGRYRYDSRGSRGKSQGNFLRCLRKMACKTEFGEHGSRSQYVW